MLVKGANDSFRFVQVTAMEVISIVANKVPEKAWPLLVEKNKYGVCEVRCSARIGLIQLAKKAPEKAWSLFVEGVKDTKSHVRQASMKGVAKLATKNLKEAWPLLVKGVQDKDSKVRQQALIGIEKIAGTDLERALRILVKSVEDKELQGTALECIINLGPSSYYSNALISNILTGPKGLKEVINKCLYAGSALLLKDNILYYAHRVNYVSLSSIKINPEMSMAIHKQISNILNKYGIEQSIPTSSKLLKAKQAFFVGLRASPSTKRELSTHIGNSAENVSWPKQCSFL